MTLGSRSQERFWIAVTVRFHATTSGSKTTSLYLTHNDSTRSPSIIPLVGVKNEMRLTVEGDTVAFRRICIGDSALLRFDVRNYTLFTANSTQNRQEYSGGLAVFF